MRRNHRDHRTSRTDSRRRLSYQPVLHYLEDRALPGDTLLGALAAHGLFAPETARPNRPELGTRESAARLSLLADAGTPAGTRFAPPETVVGPFVGADADGWSASDLSASHFTPAPWESDAAPPARAGTPAEQNAPPLAGDFRDGGAGTGGSSSPRPAESPAFAAAPPAGDAYAWVFAIGNDGRGSRVPNAPVITDPNRDGAVVSPSVHMETAPFSDPNPNATHFASEWAIQVNEPGNELIWYRRVTIDDGDPSLLLHIHLGDGLFLGSHKGRTLLRTSTNYVLFVRFQNNFTEFSPWSQRTFVTQNQIPGDPDRRWAARQAGYQVEQVAGDFKLPVNIAFVPNPTYLPNDPLYYVTELYGEVKVVTTNGHVRRFAGGDATDPAQRPFSLVNFNPTGQFPGSGEQGTTGIVVHPQTGHVYVSTVWSIGGDAPGSPHYGRVFRLESDDGGLTAARRVVVLDTACRLTWPGGTACPPGGDEAQGQSHQISNLSFGPDGFLYVHNGEGFDVARAQNVNSFGGKILRLNLDGTPIPSNPFFQAGCTHPVTGRPCARNYVYAMGLRNPFGGGWWARNNRHYTVENGPGTNDRFSELVAGRNYGWNGSDASMTNFAIYNWNPPQAPVNIGFIEPETFGGSRFPQDKWDHAFVSLSGPTYGLGPQANGKRIQEFVLNPQTGQLVAGPTPLIEYIGTGRSSVVGLAVGPDGLYFTDLYRDDGVGGPTARGAAVYRVRYGAVDFASNTNASCAAPLTVQFTDRSTILDAVYWYWTFGDGNFSIERNPTHTYTQAGTYDVTLTVYDALGNDRTVSRPSYAGAGRVGLRAEGYAYTTVDQIYQSLAPRHTRIDAQVNATVTTGLAFPEIGNTNFYVRWTGQVHTPNTAGTYAFSTVSDDGVRLWVNNQLIINNWTLHGPTVDNATITLAANTAYDIRMDYFQGGGGGEARLRWTPPGQAQQVIPQAQLCPTVTSNAIAPPSNLRVVNIIANTVELAWQNNANNAKSLVVERAPDGVNFVPVSPPLPPPGLTQHATRYVDQPPQPGTYHYRVRAANAFGSVVSNTVVVPFGLPGTLDYSNGFGNGAGLTPNGSTTFIQNLARITAGTNGQAGSFFSTNRVGIARFNSTFTFQIRPGSNPMADGMTFVIQGNAPTALGPAGGGLGYGPDQPGCCGITNSVAIKFDIYNNAGEGNNSTGLFTDGASPTIIRSGSGDVLVNLNGTGIDLHSQAIFRVDMAYSGTTLTVRITNTGTQQFAEHSYAVNIPTKVGGTLAHVGFSGGTGGLNAFQEVRTWRFDSLP